jgi:hypothetical protein
MLLKHEFCLCYEVHFVGFEALTARYMKIVSSGMLCNFTENKVLEEPPPPSSELKMRTCPEVGGSRFL